MSVSDGGEQEGGSPNRPPGPPPPPQGYPPQQPGYPPQQQGHPPQQPGYPPQQPGYPPQQPGYPPQQQGYPPQQQGYPPQQPGYPPQQPGYPPQQQGYPPQQQGYPPQQQGYPPQQQGYPPQQRGYPPQQWGYPPQQPPGYRLPGGAQRSGRRVWLIAGGVLGILLVLFIGTMVARVVLGGGSGAPAAPGAVSGPLSGKVAWQAQLPVPPAASATQQVLFQNAYGSWMADGQVGVFSPGVVAAYDLKTGRKRWALTPPAISGQPGQFCGGSLAPAQGVVAIGVGPVTAHGAGCNSVMLIDESSGAQRWMVSDPSPFALNFIHAEIVGSTVVADITGQLIGLSVANGQRVWDMRDPPLTADRYALCVAQDFMVGPSAPFVLFNCVGSAGKQVFLTQIDAAAGKVISKVEVPGGTAIGTGLVSVDPVVVAIPGATDTDGRYVVMDASGHAQVIPQSGSYGTLDLQDFSLMPASRLHRQYPLVVTGGTLVTRTVPRAVSSARTSNQLVAFDIGTGKELWSKQLVATSNSVPFGIAGKGVVAMVTGNYESPPQVYQLALSTGQAKALGPAYPRALINVPEGSLLYWKDGRVYGVHLNATGTGPGFLLYALK